MVDNTTGDNQTPRADQDGDDTSQNDINAQINRAITSRMKPLLTKIDNLTTLLAQKQDTEQKTEEKPEKVSNSEMASMKKQFDAMKAERDAEVQKRKETDLRTNTREALLKAGVPQHMVKAAMATLITEDKFIHLNDDGQVVFKSDTGEELDLGSGLKNYFKTDDGKVFLPAKAVAGSGDKNYRAPNNNKSPTQTTDELAALLTDLRFQNG